MKFFVYSRWFREELKKTTGKIWFFASIGGAFFLVCGFVMIVLTGHYLNTNFYQLPPLPDLGYRVLPRVLGLMFLDRTGLLTSLILFGVGLSREPHRIPYIFFIASLWFFIRIISMVITPFGAPQTLPIPPNFNIESIWDLIKSGLGSKHTLFFSGHTGLPFLGFLIFRSKIRVKILFIPLLFLVAYYLLLMDYSLLWISILSFVSIVLFPFRRNVVQLKFVFLVWSFLMASTVLLVRGHYSIDVFGAYFMTGGIYFFGRYLFRWLEKICETLESDFKSNN
ncbi:MAG: hypothetical protein AAB884_01515 [Patescibacteria group bacterium]